MANENGILLVQALYPFTGKNNDELCFKKGDLIIVTQKEDGGWWEGTLNENTGWFPSNYVKEHKAIVDGTANHTDADSPPLSPQQTQQQILYRSMVSKEIVESERNHVKELQNFYTKYLTALQSSDIISDSEFKQLTGNLEEIISVHNRLLSLLEEQFELSAKEQRIGGTFLKIAPSLQNAHKIYIANHPKAVCIIEKFKDELNSFMECHGATRPGVLVLTTALSQPFRRLDKYPGVLQEFQRHMEESHPDRGDTQRSTHVFRDLACTCSSIRRQKQLELEVLTNKVHGWEGGESLSVLGDIIHMRSVALLPDNRDRYLVLFPSCLVILALSSRASSFIFEGKYQLNSIAVNKLEDGSQYKNAFEITGTQISKIVAICQSSSDQQQWVEILSHHVNCAKNVPLGSRKNSSSFASPPPSLPAHGTVPLVLPHHNTSTSKNEKLNIKPWSLSCLRPSPPLRPGFSLRDDKKKTKKKDESWHEDDALILRVIEYYCTSAKARYTVNSSLIDNPQLIVAADEKMIVEETRGNKTILEEKSLVDTVYALKDQLAEMCQNYQELRNEFEMEKKLTQKLKHVIDQYITVNNEKVSYTSL
ncbi:UNVERIFIED_CONTAM: hypothetical protein RMT77_006910 [Armadillidium vulgare]